jgi:hypothetical protein
VLGLGDLLKRALGAVGEFDRKVVYGPDYKQRGEALAELNELTLRGKLLENQGKFERLQELKREAEMSAFKQATVLGASQDTTPIPGMVSPDNPSANIEDIDPNNILHRAGEGVTEPPLPSVLTKQIGPQDTEALHSAIRGARGIRKVEERQKEELLQSRLAADRALVDQRGAMADKLDRTPGAGAGGGGARPGPDYYVTMTWTDGNGVEHKQRMRSSEAAKMGELVNSSSGERKDIQQAVEDLAMARALRDNFKPEFTDRVNNVVQGVREGAPGFMNDMGLVDSPDPLFAQWRANNKKLNNALIRELSGAQVTPSEYPRITGQLALPELNPEAWKARNAAQIRALEVAIAVRTGKMGVEQARQLLRGMEDEVARAEGGTSRPPTPGGSPSPAGAEAPPPGWEYVGRVLQKVRQ